MTLSAACKKKNNINYQEPIQYRMEKILHFLKLS